MGPKIKILNFELDEKLGHHARKPGLREIMEKLNFTPRGTWLWSKAVQEITLRYVTPGSLEGMTPNMHRRRGQTQGVSSRSVHVQAHKVL